MNTSSNQASDLELPRRTLFETPGEARDRPAEKHRRPPPPKPRLQRAERHQMEWLPMALDDLIPQNHEARSVWEFAEKMNLTPLYARIAAVEGRPGRDTIDPKILMALWLYATIDGVGSARKLDDLCKRHHAYRWLNEQLFERYGKSPEESLVDGGFSTLGDIETLATSPHLKRPNRNFKKPQTGERLKDRSV